MVDWIVSLARDDDLVTAFWLPTGVSPVVTPRPHVARYAGPDSRELKSHMRRQLCLLAALRRHLEGCPWNCGTCMAAAEAGQWPLPMGRCPVQSRSGRRLTRGAVVGGRAHVRFCSERRPPRGAGVGARERLPVGTKDPVRPPQPRMNWKETLEWAHNNSCPVDASPALPQQVRFVRQR